MTKPAKKITLKDLSRFGLQHSTDVKLYLASPEGKAIIGMIENEISDLRATEAAVRTEQQRAQLRRHHMIIFLLIGMIEEKSAHAKKLHLHAQQEIDRMFDDERKRRDEADEQILERVLIESHIDTINETISTLIPRITNSSTELQNTEDALALLLTEVHELEARFVTYFSSLDEVHYSDEKDDDAQVKTLISTIETQIDSYTKITAALLHEGKETDALQNQDRTYALRMKAEKLNQLHNARVEERHLYNHLAQRVHSLDEAVFFLPKDKTLTLEKGQFYLHSRSKEWTGLAPKERHEAQMAFRDTSRDIMSIKMQLQHQRAQALQHNQHQQTIKLERRDTLRQELQVLNTLLVKARDTHSNLQQRLQQTPPQPRPGINPSHAAQQGQQKKNMAMGIRPNDNPMALQQLDSPKNTGATSPSTTPTPFDIRLKKR